MAAKKNKHPPHKDKRQELFISLKLQKGDWNRTIHKKKEKEEKLDFTPHDL